MLRTLSHSSRSATTLLDSRSVFQRELDAMVNDLREHAGAQVEAQGETKFRQFGRKYFSDFAGFARFRPELRVRWERFPEPFDQILIPIPDTEG